MKSFQKEVQVLKVLKSGNTSSLIPSFGSNKFSNVEEGFPKILSIKEENDRGEILMEALG